MSTSCIRFKKTEESIEKNTAHFPLRRVKLLNTDGFSPLVERDLNSILTLTLDNVAKWVKVVSWRRGGMKEENSEQKLAKI